VVQRTHLLAVLSQIGVAVAVQSESITHSTHLREIGSQTPDMLASAKANDVTLRQLVRLASLVGKGAAAPDERPLVAAV